VIQVNRIVKLSVVIGSLVAAGAHGADSAPSIEELWQIVQAQQQELERLRQELDTSKSQARTVENQLLETSERLDAVGEVIDQPNRGGASWADKTRIGAYGEMLYNDGTQSSSSRELDIQRFVTYLEHNFNDNLRFFSELEVEHALIEGANSPGAVELEQAYLEWDYANDHSVLAGMHLAPVGILNETHEPNTFYGVERNLVESRIIPTTYSVNGVKFAGRLGLGFSYDFGVHEGLFFEGGNGGDIAIRSARQSGARAELDSPAVTGRLRYTGVPGLELGATLQYQTDMTQNGSKRGNIGRNGLIDAFGNPVSDISGVLSEAHLVYSSGPWGLRALWAQWSIDNKIESIADSNIAINGLGRDRQTGYYIEPSYRFSEKFGAFYRYERIDERAGSNTGAAKDSAIGRNLLGANYWLTSNAVMKLDYQFGADDKDRNLEGFNLGIGWQF